MTDVTVEATGETVGEAKWAALRELELRHPGLDKTAVQFEVVSEGERGLLGVECLRLQRVGEDRAERDARAGADEGGCQEEDAQQRERPFEVAPAPQPPLALVHRPVYRPRGRVGLALRS